MCVMLLYVKAFSKTIIMSVNRVSDLTRRVTKWLETVPRGSWVQSPGCLEGTGSWQSPARTYSALLAGNWMKTFRARLSSPQLPQAQRRDNSSTILAMLRDPLDSPQWHFLIYKTGTVIPISQGYCEEWMSYKYGKGATVKLGILLHMEWWNQDLKRDWSWKNGARTNNY